MRVQRGTTALQNPPGNTATASIAAVDPAKAFCRLLGVSINTNIGFTMGAAFVRIYLANSTTVTIIREANNAGEIASVSWEVVDFP